jgi:hypothetical protein
MVHVTDPHQARDLLIGGGRDRGYYLELERQAFATPPAGWCSLVGFGPQVYSAMLSGGRGGRPEATLTTTPAVGTQNVSNTIAASTPAVGTGNLVLGGAGFHEFVYVGFGAVGGRLQADPGRLSARLESVDVRRPFFALLLSDLSDPTTTERGTICRHGIVTGREVRSSRAPQLERLLARLATLGSLPAGWDGYGAAPPAVPAIQNAEGFLRSIPASGPFPELLSPSVVGGVGLTFAGEAGEVYVEFYNDGRVYAVFSDGRADPAVMRVSAGPDGFDALAREIRGYLG